MREAGGGVRASLGDNVTDQHDESEDDDFNLAATARCPELHLRAWRQGGEKADEEMKDDEMEGRHMPGVVWLAKPGSLTRAAPCAMPGMATASFS